MATKRIDQLTALSANVAGGDLLEITDVSDTGDRAEGTTKKATRDELVPAATASLAGISELATTAEVDTGTDTVRSITPDALNASTPTLTGTNFTGIPGAGMAIATSSARGSVEFATEAEVNTGTDTALAVTPDSLGTIQTDVTANTAKASYAVFSFSGRQPGAATATRIMGPVPVAGTVTDVVLVTSVTTVSTSGNLWAIGVQNLTNSSADLLAAAYDTFAIADITLGVKKDLGALHGTGANLVLAKGDTLQIVWTETGTATDMVSNACWLFITITPS